MATSSGAGDENFVKITTFLLSVDLSYLLLIDCNSLADIFDEVYWMGGGGVDFSLKIEYCV